MQKALLPQLKQTNVSLARCWTDLGSRSDWSFSAIGRISDGFLPLHNPRPLPPSFPPVSQFSFPSSPPSPPLPGAPLQPPPVCSLLDEQGQGGRQTRKSHQTSTGDSAQTETPVDLAHRKPPPPPPAPRNRTSRPLVHSPTPASLRTPHDTCIIPAQRLPVRRGQRKRAAASSYCVPHFGHAGVGPVRRRACL